MIEKRQSWLRVLVLSPTSSLENALASVAPYDLEEPDINVLRAPEIGMVMARGRMGGTGAAFNMGEVSVTRCAVADRQGRVGQSYVMGRDKRKAELVARLDLFLQDPAHQERLWRDVVEPLAKELDASATDLSRKAAATRVEFFTMARGS